MFRVKLFQTDSLVVNLPKLRYNIELPGTSFNLILLRLNGNSDQLGLKRPPIEHFKGYPMIYEYMKFDLKVAWEFKFNDTRCQVKAKTWWMTFKVFEFNIFSIKW